MKAPFQKPWQEFCQTKNTIRLADQVWKALCTKGDITSTDFKTLLDQLENQDADISKGRSTFLQHIWTNICQSTAHQGSLRSVFGGACLLGVFLKEGIIQSWEPLTKEPLKTLVHEELAPMDDMWGPYTNYSVSDVLGWCWNNPTLLGEFLSIPTYQQWVLQAQKLDNLDWTKYFSFATKDNQQHVIGEILRWNNKVARSWMLGLCASVAPELVPEDEPVVLSLCPPEIVRSKNWTSAIDATRDEAFVESCFLWRTHSEDDIAYLKELPWSVKKPLFEQAENVKLGQQPTQELLKLLDAAPYEYAHKLLNDWLRYEPEEDEYHDGSSRLWKEYLSNRSRKEMLSELPEAPPRPKKLM